MTFTFFLVRSSSQTVETAARTSQLVEQQMNVGIHTYISIYLSICTYQFINIIQMHALDIDIYILCIIYNAPSVNSVIPPMDSAILVYDEWCLIFCSLAVIFGGWAMSPSLSPAVWTESELLVPESLSNTGSSRITSRISSLSRCSSSYKLISI